MKRIAISSIVIAFLAISNHSFAQVRLGLSNSARLSSAATVSTPSVSNALRASAAATRATANATASTAQATASTAQATTSSAQATTSAAQTTTPAAKATATSANPPATNAHVNADASVQAKAAAGAGVKNN
jgi:hypothetical protein